MSFCTERMSGAASTMCMPACRGCAKRATGSATGKGVSGLPLFWGGPFSAGAGQGQKKKNLE